MRQQKTGLEFGLIALFWILVLSLFPFSFDLNWPTEFWFRQLFLAVLLIGSYYLHSKYILPKTLNENRFLQYTLAIAVLITVMMVVLEFFEHQIDLPRKLHELFRPNRPFNPERAQRFDYIIFTYMLFNFTIGIIVYLVRKNQIESERRKELERLQISTELSYLKAQINPHFFFNTLNNIYALTSFDVEASRTAILKLSSMMRYVIYEGRSKFASLANEISFIENYIELMKLRLSSKVTVAFNKPSQPGDSNIAPMILLPFVENAFKHGVSSTNPTEILISIETKAKSLDFFVRNKIVAKPQLSNDEHGIGIANTKRRLELMYPGSHELKIEDKDDTFTVSLHVDL